MPIPTSNMNRKVEAPTVASAAASAGQYRFLQAKTGSNFRQLFVNGRIRAEILYRETIGSEPLTAEEVAVQYDLPVEAVHEAIQYCIENQYLLENERTQEAARIQSG